MSTVHKPHPTDPVVTVKPTAVGPVIDAMLKRLPKPKTNSGNSLGRPTRRDAVLPGEVAGPPRPTEGHITMKRHRIITLALAAVLTATASLAGSARAHASVLQNIGTGKCLHPVAGSLDEGAGIVQQICKALPHSNGPSCPLAAPHSASRACSAATAWRPGSAPATARRSTSGSATRSA